MTNTVSVVEVSQVSKRFGAITAVDQVSLAVVAGETLSLLGPSGCGKTTTLRLIAGFETPDVGAIHISGRDMRGKRPYERDIGFVFQDYALFPHMTVEENIAFGMRHRGIDRRDIPKRSVEILSLVKLTGLERRYPAALSGGQQQRVALARALVIRPAVMLLDEPLAALDAKLRAQLRTELREILASVRTTTIIVTHDQEEAMSLADRVVVMNEGRIEQEGTPKEVYSRPRTKFVAEFIGRLNWIPGAFVREVEAGLWEYRTENGSLLQVSAPRADGNRRRQVGVRPERLRVRTPNQDSPALGNLIEATIRHVNILGPDIHRLMELDSGARLIAIEKDLGQPVEPVGSRVSVAFAAGDCIVVEADATESG